MTKMEIISKMYEMFEMICEEKGMAWYTVIEEFESEVESKVKSIKGVTESIYSEWLTEVVMDI